METIHYTIDARDQSLGRVASEAAKALLGKKSAQFVNNAILPMTVTITNASKLSLPLRRVAGKAYTHYTGYPGGLITTSLSDLIEKKGVAEAIRKAVDGMLPRNKLRKGRMKLLTITD
jgi:large subunit ribosomal protein L13